MKIDVYQDEAEEEGEDDESGDQGEDQLEEVQSDESYNLLRRTSYL